jgi:protein LSM14
MSSPAMPYVGSRISLISKSEIRYEGILYVINTEESTIALQNVRSYGTEGRTTPDVPATDEVYDFIIFRGEDIKDLTVLEGTATKPSKRAVLEDPAVVSVGPERKVASRQAPSYAKETHNREQRGAYHREQPTERYDRGNRRENRNVTNNTRQVQSHGQQQHNRERTQGHTAQGKGHGKGGQRRSFQHNNHRGGPVGELKANENAQTKAEVGSEEFDFSSANEKFEKPAEDSKDISVADTRAGYSKTKGFFDDISCDALDRASNKEAGRMDRTMRDKQRELDKETFGASAMSRPFGYGGHRRYQHGKGGKGKAY